MLTLRRSRVYVLVAAGVLAAGCSDGPTYPKMFEPNELGDQVASANSALQAPASQSFGALGYAIDDALWTADGGALVQGTAMLLMEEAPSPAKLASRLRASMELRTADAIPAPVLGKTFEWDTEAGRYAISDRAGAPANGVRFILYAADPDLEEPILPLTEVGYADLTRGGTTNRPTARVQVFSGGVSPIKVIDYTASASGSLSTVTFTVSGFAKNAADSLGFDLGTSFSFANETIQVDWRTTLPSRGLSSRMRQTIAFSIGEEEFDLNFSLNAYVRSSSGQVDMVGQVNALTQSTIAVRVNGRTFATLTFNAVSGEPPTIVNAQGQPLTPAEEAALRQIFSWFSDSFQIYATLLAPVGTLMD